MLYYSDAAGGSANPSHSSHLQSWPNMDYERTPTAIGCMSLLDNDSPGGKMRHFVWTFLGRHIYAWPHNSLVDLDDAEAFALLFCFFRIVFPPSFIFRPPVMTDGLSILYWSFCSK